MRLLHVIHTLNPASGGVAEAVRNFVLHPADSTQAVLTLDHSSDPWTRSYASEVFCAGPGRGKYGFTPRLSAWLRAQGSAFDALILHGCWQFHSLAASRAARATGQPYFVFPHGMLDPFFNRALPFKRLKKRLYWPFERSVLENARAVFFTCAEERARARQAYSWRSPDKISPLGCSAPTVNMESVRAEFLRRFPDLAGRRIILFLGRLHPKKGVDLLLRAFAQCDAPDAHLVIAGPAESTWAEQLKRLAPKTRVTFTGMLTGRLKCGALAAAEALALPSHQENFGMSVVEALAFGCPVLLSDQVNTWREIIADGAGFVAPDTQEGTMDLLRRWFALTSSEQAVMRNAAAACFQNRFRAEIASDNLLTILRALLTHERHHFPIHA